MLDDDKKSSKRNAPKITDTFEAPPEEDELEDEDDEEMPIDCRLRMRNLGKATKTSAGPNSYLKDENGLGFQDLKAYTANKKAEMENYFYELDKKEIEKSAARQQKERMERLQVTDYSHQSSSRSNSRTELRKSRWSGNETSEVSKDIDGGRVKRNSVSGSSITSDYVSEIGSRNGYEAKQLQNLPYFLGLI